MTELVDRLLAHYDDLLGHRYPREHEDAWTDAADLVRADPEQGWALIVELVERIPAAAIGYFAAGPLEDFIDFHPAFAAEHLEARISDQTIV
ncbi:MAG TPA: hypothetical protein VFJ85_03070 [Acidimicrobiales bacterium]|nr:hypothetical protein [Acidimicrobiales bacterium]